MLSKNFGANSADHFFSWAAFGWIKRTLVVKLFEGSSLKDWGAKNNMDNRSVARERLAIFRIRKLEAMVKQVRSSYKFSP